MTFARYVLIQILAYAMDMGGYVLCLLIGLTGPVVTNMLAKTSAGLFAFFAHRHLTFVSGARTDRTHQAVRYFILLGLNVPFASAALALLLVWVSAPVIAKLLSDVLSVGLTFWLSKNFVFVPRQQHAVHGSDGLTK